MTKPFTKEMQTGFKKKKKKESSFGNKPTKWNNSKGKNATFNSSQLKSANRAAGFGNKPTKWRTKKLKPPTEEEINNKDDIKYLNWLKKQDLACFSCGKKGLNIEIHHIKDYSMQAKNHREILPLCAIECHRLGKFSAHGNAKWFKKTFPIEVQRKYASVLYSIYCSLESVE